MSKGKTLGHPFLLNWSALLSWRNAVVHPFHRAEGKQMDIHEIRVGGSGRDSEDQSDSRRTSSVLIRDIHSDSKVRRYGGYNQGFKRVTGKEEGQGGVICQYLHFIERWVCC